MTNTQDDKVHITDGQWVMLTLTPEHQHILFGIQARLNDFSKIGLGIKKALNKCFSSYEGYLELSEPVHSAGKKHMPRLHYHFLGKVDSAICYLLTLGYFVGDDIGYHHTKIENEKHYNQKYEYIKKQYKYWRQSQYTIQSRFIKLADEESEKSKN